MHEDFLLPSTLRYKLIAWGLNFFSFSLYLSHSMMLLQKKETSVYCELLLYRNSFDWLKYILGYYAKWWPKC